MSTTLEDQRKADLLSLVKQAKRCQHIHRRFELDDEPTEWDRRHADIDALLDVYQRDHGLA